jgi:hypothetical protein
MPQQLANAVPAPSDPAERALLEQAKGVLMLRYGIGSFEALAVLAEWSREAGVELLDLARGLVRGVCQGRVEPDDEGTVTWLHHRLRTEVHRTDHVPAASPAASAAPPTPSRTAFDIQQPGTEDRQAPDVRVLKRWRYASAVHAARVVCRA